MRHNKIDVLLTVAWLLGILFGYNLFDEDQRLEGMFLTLTWIGPYCVLRLVPLGRSLQPRRVSVLTPCALVFMLFLLCCLPGCLSSLDPGTALRYLAATAAAGMTCLAVGFLLGPALPRALALYALTAAGALTWIAFRYYEGGRFGVFRNPNSVGLILLGIYALSFLAPSRWLRLVVACTALGLLLLTGSRSAMLGAAVFSAAVASTGLLLSGRRSARLVLALGILCAGPLAYSVEAAARMVVYRAFKLDDPWRGLRNPQGTIQARFRVWEETWRLWLEHPWFGVGYRTHELHLTVASSSHNGYLAVLAETGVVGASVVAALLAVSGRTLLRGAAHGSLTSRVAISLLLGYLTVGMFERYLLNIGNPTSVIVLLFLLRPDLERSSRRRLLVVWRT